MSAAFLLSLLILAGAVSWVVIGIKRLVDRAARDCGWW